MELKRTEAQTSMMGKDVLDLGIMIVMNQCFVFANFQKEPDVVIKMKDYRSYDEFTTDSCGTNK